MFILGLNIQGLIFFLNIILLIYYILFYIQVEHS